MRQGHSQRRGVVHVTSWAHLVFSGRAEPSGWVASRLCSQPVGQPWASCLVLVLSQSQFLPQRLAHYDLELDEDVRAAALAEHAPPTAFLPRLRAHLPLPRPFHFPTLW